MMVQIALYFGSYVLTGMNMDGFLAALVAVSLRSAAYVQIIHSGIQSVDKGQTGLVGARSVQCSDYET